MTRIFVSTVFALVMTLRAAFAQEDTAWVQVEALPSLLEAEERVRDYAAVLPSVAGFSVGSGWYAIVIGPFGEQQAGAVLRQLRRNGQIPRDSFVARSSSFRQQFWPVGANALSGRTTPAPAPSETDTATDTAQAPQAEPEETLREAQRAEARLDTQAKKDLQIALQWAGFYNSSIDAAFGGGTRRAMAAWQEANGFQPTGVLTTRQRATLMGQYNAVLEGMDLQLVSDDTTGIQIKLPMGVVAFEAHESPFARYEPRGDLGARVLLISQRGDQRRLFGLYDILQTLEVVPLDGPRQRRNNGFTITGTNSRIVSHTEVSLRNGEIKGFMLIWPAGDEERRLRVLQEMSTSFARINGVMPTTTGVADGQSVDLLSGLQIRKPKMSRTGFYVSTGGAVMTTFEAVAGCSRVTLDGKIDARVAMTDEALGLALLTPQSSLAPMEVAELAGRAPRLQSEVAVAGYSYEGVLGAPSMTFGKLVDLRGLQGEEAVDRFDLASLPGDAGGPVMDATGAVIGMLLPRAGEDRQLPKEVSFSADAGALQDAMRKAGISARIARDTGAMAPEDLTRKGRGLAVLVSCWE
mgnify:FL=1